MDNELSQQAKDFSELMAVEIVAMAQQMAARMTLQALALAEQQIADKTRGERQKD